MYVYYMYPRNDKHNVCLYTVIVDRIVANSLTNKDLLTT